MSTLEELRDFFGRVSEMIEYLKENNPELHQDLLNKCVYWAPEVYPNNLSNWVNSRYPLNPNDVETLTVYSLLTNRPIEVLKQQMQEHLGLSPRL